MLAQSTLFISNEPLIQFNFMWNLFSDYSGNGRENCEKTTQRMFSDLVFAVSPWKICSSVQSTHFNRYSFPMSLWYNGEIFSATIWAMAEKITVKNVLRFNFHSKPLKNIAHSPPFKRYSSSMSLWYKAYYKTNIASLMRMNGQKLVEVARRWKRERSGFKTRTRHFNFQWASDIKHIIKPIP